MVSLTDKRLSHEEVFSDLRRKQRPALSRIDQYPRKAIVSSYIHFKEQGVSNDQL
ncbi:hypothetical protein FACS1894163_08040 [Spirochaetia bacterium]|nr:hypothetical protein FACS1894163_08040 [Spirochaetia bacterium]